MNKRFLILSAWVVFAVMLAVGPAMAGDAAKAQKIGDLFVAIDTNKDGKIDQVEYVAYTKDEVKAKKEFKALDKDGDTVLVIEELTITKLNTKAAPKKAPAAK